MSNVIGYQLLWLACVVGAGNGKPWLGPLVALAFVGATLIASSKPGNDVGALLVVLPLGLALDSAFAASGWLVYAQAWPWQLAAPAWIWALWAGFALTLNRSLAFLHGRPWLAALLGLIGGPLAYWAAGSLGAVAFAVPPAWPLAALALSWAVLLPLSSRLTARFAPSAAVPA